MERRTVLAVMGATISAMSGCLTEALDGTSEARSTPTPQIVDFDCPPFPLGDEDVVCSHDVNTDSAPVYLLPSETVVNETSAVDLTLHNRSSESLVFNPYSWTVMRTHGDGWEEVKATVSGNGKETLPPGASRMWTFEEVIESIEPDAAIGPAMYSVMIRVPSPDGGSTTALVATFRID